MRDVAALPKAGCPSYRAATPCRGVGYPARPSRVVRGRSRRGGPAGRHHVNHFGGARFFAASTVIHVALLLIFAGISLTVIRSVQTIPVKIEEVGIETEGQPSTEDYAGLLEVTKAPRRDAQRPQGPIVRNVKAPRVPTLASVGPKLGTGPAVDINTAALTLGGGGIGGLGGSFGDYVGGLRKTGLDLVLVIDTTESMQFVIDEVKEHASSLVKTIQRMVPTSRVGVVAYRDQGDEYVTKWSDLSFKTDKLTSFISTITASGGGDWEEAVLDGVDAAIKELSWRKKSKKIIVLIGGSPPHPEDVKPLEALVSEFRRDGGTSAPSTSPIICTSSSATRCGNR